MGEIALALATDLDDHSQVAPSPEALLGRHCVILGSSGSGKSWSLARIVEQIGALGGKVLLLDPSGEFCNLHRDAFHVHLGTASRPPTHSHFATLPYFELPEAALVQLLAPATASQTVKLRTAIKTLKLLQVAPHLGDKGNFHKAHKSKTDFESTLQLYQSEIEQLGCIFNIQKLPLQIELECVEPTNGHLEAERWGSMLATELAECAPLIDRLEEMLRSREFRPILAPPPEPTAFEALEKFISDPNVSILRISLEFLATSHGIRQFAGDVLANHLLSIGRSGALQDRPLVIAVDDAYQLVSREAPAGSGASSRPAFETIAQEGRKHGITMCLATPRPGDLPEQILGQCGACIIHRSMAAGDHEAVARLAGAGAQHLGPRIAALAPGEALILGTAFRQPRRVKIMSPLSPPAARGPNYQSGWRPRHTGGGAQ